MGQIDASIPLSVKPPVIEDAISPFVRAQTFKQNQMTLAANERKMQQEQQDQDDDDAVRFALQEHADDPDKAVLKLRSSGRGTAAIKLDGLLADARKKHADERLSNLKITKEHLDTLGNTALSIKQLPKEARATAWAPFRKSAIDRLGPDIEASLPETYDDATLDRLIIESGKITESVALAKRATQDAIDAIKLDTDGLESIEKWKRAIAADFSLASDQAHWDQLRTLYSQAGPTAKRVLDVLPPMWSKPAQDTMRQMAMTADQRADNERADKAAAEAAKNRGRTAGRTARTEARTDQREKDVEEAFPKPVKAFLNRLPLSVKDRAGALEKVRNEWPTWITQYPGIDRSKINATIDALFGKPPTDGLPAEISAIMNGVTPDEAMPEAAGRAALIDEANRIGAEYQKPGTTLARKQEIQKRLQVLAPLIK